MRIAIAGQWRWPQYEAAFARGLREHGVEVIEIDVSAAFSGLIGRVQYAFPVAGPAARRMGRAVVKAARAARPDYLLFWRPTHLLRETLDALSGLGIKTVSYNNDDPFSPRLNDAAGWRARNAWRLYRRALPSFDHNFFYRQVNVDEAPGYGARHADLLLPYFMPWQDRPVELDDAARARFGADIAFVGHYEDDGRDEDLVALANAGLRVRVWGDATWQESRVAQSGAVPGPIVPALGDDYARALGGADICLCYMSKLNRDGYTRRCFEIPAMGRAMLAERTPELAALFREDEEACFFGSREELVAKAKRLKEDDAFRMRIADGGQRRVWADGHDVASRARQFMTALMDDVVQGGRSQ